MAKRQRADIKAALAAASGVELDQDQERQSDRDPRSEEKPEQVLESGENPRKKKKRREGTGHQRTSTGYVKSDGQEVVRLTLHMSAAQKRRFKIEMITRGFDNPSSFVIDVLDLNKD